MPTTSPTPPSRCDGGCTFWDCAREMGHPGPCYPAERPEDRERYEALMPVREVQS